MSVQQIRAALRLQLRPRTPAALTSSDTSLPASDRSPLASTHTSRFGRLAAAIPGSQAHMLPRRTFVSHVSPREFQSEGPAARGPHQRLRQRALLYREWQEKRRKEREAKTARVQVLDEEKAKRARERAESQVGEVVISKRGKAVQVRQNPRYAPNPVVPWERQLKKGSNNWRKRRSMILRARRQMYAPPGQFTAFNAHTDYDPFVRHAPKIQLPDLRGQTFLDVKVAGTDDRVSHGVRDQLHARIIGDTQAHPLRHATLAGTQPEYASLEGRPLQPAQKLLSSSERFFRATGVDVYQTPSSPLLSFEDPGSGSLVLSDNPQVLAGTSSFSQPEMLLKKQCVTTAIIGTPNAGKSTLLNQLMNEKISAVSQKVNTTRGNIIGVSTHHNVQIVFQDTPGVVHKQHKAHLKRLSASAVHAGRNCDVVLVVMDAVKKIGLSERELLMKAKKMLEENPIMELVLVLNKIDLSPDYDRLFLLSEEISKHVPFTETFYVSAASGEGVEEIRDFLMDVAPFREWQYNADDPTPMTPLERVQEIIKEQLYRFLHQEIPYQVVQENLGWTEMDDGKLRIDQKLTVPKSSQRDILMGTNGATIRAIGRAAAPEIERVLNRRVNLVFHCVALQK